MGNGILTEAMSCDAHLSFGYILKEVSEAAIGGNHVGADLLPQIVIDKYRYHLPEYRQVKQLQKNRSIIRFVKKVRKYNNLF